MRNYQQISVNDRPALRRWLTANHRQSESIWLVFAKRGEPDYLSYPAIVEEALCFGWVDSLPRALDERRTMILLSPRKAGSAWSKPNRERAERLIAGGLMQPAGAAKIAAACSDGSWDRLKAAEAGVVPDDLATALRATADARAGFDALSAAKRRNLIDHVTSAKRAETRAARIAKVVAAAAEGRDALAWVRKS